MQAIESVMHVTRKEKELRLYDYRTARKGDMKTFTVYRTKAREVVNDFEKSNYRDGDLPQFEGVIFHDGSVSVRWFTETKSMSYWATLEDLKKVHIYGHPDYGTRIEYSDGLVELL